MTEATTSSRIFQHYQKEVESLISELRAQVDQAYSSLVSLDERKTSLKNAERLLDEVSQGLHSLELEAYSETVEPQRRNDVQRVSSLKKQLESLRKDWKDAKIILSEERDKLERNDLLKEVEQDLESGSLEQRQKFVSVSGKLEKGKEVLHDSRKTLEETEQVTRGILEDLR
ncbi:vesicle transport V-snare protein [Galdieria sulphuraria]|uniref:Vesicle transport V-snare protein n=1 Tax=Galdieria sulphuraria TaxID=130081 RepID=M2W198_GALSU|nr:vesicle transport V-snare protein [Galdieria sulphuraria]EME29416.1 vesicle transport V-snare protein [Galdieria sulphuraria]|eukprot:XP_005705936.1 vesicle transport V-snare protein [Galdieria sulphuraria]